MPACALQMLLSRWYHMPCPPAETHSRRLFVKMFRSCGGHGLDPLSAQDGSVNRRHRQQRESWWSNRHGNVPYSHRLDPAVSRRRMLVDADTGTVNHDDILSKALEITLRI